MLLCLCALRQKKESMSKWVQPCILPTIKSDLCAFVPLCLCALPKASHRLEASLHSYLHCAAYFRAESATSLGFHGTLRCHKYVVACFRGQLQGTYIHTHTYTHTYIGVSGNKKVEQICRSESIGVSGNKKLSS